MKKADIGLIGLAVMGENLVMNMESKGFTVAVFNRTTSKVDAFVVQGLHRGRLQPHHLQGGRLRERPGGGQEHHRLPQP